jgi:hypothetical protein
MLVTTLSLNLLNEYGLSTVATWHESTTQRIVLVINPDEISQFESRFGSAYSLIPFSDESLRCIASILKREQELKYRRGDYRWQATRFSWKVFAMKEAFQAFPEDYVATWLDADSLLKQGFDDWLCSIFSESHAVSFLGRSHKQLHVESGLIHFRGASGQELFRRVLDIYASLRIFDFNEWHDGYIYNHIFQFYKGCYDICRHRKVKSSNPLYEIDRGRHLLHLKGNRKDISSTILDGLRVILRR